MPTTYADVDELPLGEYEINVGWKEGGGFCMWQVRTSAIMHYLSIYNIESILICISGSLVFQTENKVAPNGSSTRLINRLLIN